MEERQFKTRLRLKSTKDGKVTSIHDFNAERKNRCNHILENSKNIYSYCIVLGFDSRGDFHINHNTMNKSDMALLIRKLNNYLDDN